MSSLLVRLIPRKTPCKLSRLSATLRDTMASSKDCLQSRWTDNPSHHRPTCKRRSSMTIRIDLKNVCEAFLQDEDGRRSPSLCTMQSEKDQAKHLGFNIWTQMNTPVVLDPNWIQNSSSLIGLTSVSNVQGRELPDNPERLVLDSEDIDSGTHSRDVCLVDSEEWAVGVCAEYIQREEPKESGLWGLRFCPAPTWFEGGSGSNPLTQLLTERDR